jgi:hypothetical protein
MYLPVLTPAILRPALQNNNRNRKYKLREREVEVTILQNSIAEAPCLSCSMLLSTTYQRHRCVNVRRTINVDFIMVPDMYIRNYDCVNHTVHITACFYHLFSEKPIRRCLRENRTRFY